MYTEQPIYIHVFYSIYVYIYISIYIYIYYIYIYIYMSFHVRIHRKTLTSPSPHGLQSSGPSPLRRYFPPRRRSHRSLEGRAMDAMGEGISPTIAMDVNGLWLFG